MSPWNDGPWQDGYDRQPAACHDVVRAPAVDVAGGLDKLESRLDRDGYPRPAAASDAARRQVMGPP